MFIYCKPYCLILSLLRLQRNKSEKNTVVLLQRYFFNIYSDSSQYAIHMELFDYVLNI